MELQVRQVTCPACFAKFNTLSKRRKFCSPKCRARYHTRLSWLRRISDPAVKERELLRLKAWKETHRKSSQERVGWVDITII
jgi:protein-arginine kinase activator protein McsA